MGLIVKKAYFGNKTIVFVLFILVRLVCWAEGAWLDGWSRRAPITVTGSTVGAQTNYQVKREVTYDADMQGDFDDIRFTSSDGITLLDYWLEVSTPSIAATFWIEVPSIPVSPGTGSIYIYYGNPSVGSDADGGNTFILFDDFNYQDADADTALWTPRYEVGSSLGLADIGITESGKLRTYQDRADGVEQKKWYAVHGDGQQLPVDFAAEVEWRILTDYPDAASNSFEVRNINQLTGETGFVEIGRAYYQCSTNGIRMSQDNSNDYTFATQSRNGKYRLRKLGNTIYGDYDIGGGWVNLGSYSISYDTYIGFAAKSWVYEMQCNADCRWENLFIHQYVSPEPLVGPIGGEDGGGSNTMFTDASGIEKFSYNTQEGIYVTVIDADENNNGISRETVTVTLTDSFTGDSETITLTETGNDTGIFRNTVGLGLDINFVGVPGNSQLEVAGGENIKVSYTDDDDFSDISFDNVSAAITVKDKLHSNFPNPFRPHKDTNTTIQYDLEQDVNSIRIQIYTVNGDLIKKWEGETTSGRHRILWDGKNDNKKAVSSGMYFIVIKKNGKIMDRKRMVIIK